MNAAADAVRTLMMPIHGATLVVPNVAVAEIIDFQEPAHYGTDGPDWLLGEISWRGQALPVISYEALSGAAVPVPNAQSRIAVINSAGGGNGLPFYALVTVGIPRLVRADRETLRNADDPQPSNDMELGRVEVRGEAAIIPNLVAMEAAAGSHWSAGA